MEKNIIEQLNQISNRLSEIMDLSFPNCNHEDSKVSLSSSKINNIAFELKKLAVILKNQIQNTSPSL